MAGKLTDDKVMSASRLPSLMGVSKYKSANEELQSSIDAIDGKKRQDITNEQMEWGNDLEPVVLRKACKRLGIKGNVNIRVPYAHPTLPLQCSLDGIGFGKGQTIKHDPDKGIFVIGMDEIVLVGDGVLEAKTTRVSPEDTPDLARGPIQLQGQMMVTGMKWGAVCVFYQGSTLRIFLFAPHQQTMDAIAQAVTDFDAKLKTYQDSGAIDWYPPNSSKDMDRMFPSAATDQITLPADCASLAGQIVQNKLRIKEIEAQIEADEIKIKSVMGDAAKAVGGGYTISWPMRSYKAQPEKLVPAKEAYSIRQSNLTIKATND